MGILDYFADATSLREECAQLWKRLGGLRSELKDLDASLARMSGEKDYNEAQYSQLEAASIREGELAELEEEQKQLANAEEIKGSLCAVEELMADSPLREVEKLLSKVGRFVPSVSALSDRVEECRLELDDILSDVSRLNSATEISQSRLEEVEERMSLIYSLLRKHNCADEAELIAVRDRLSEALYDSTHIEEKRADLVKEIASVESQLDSAANSLHEKRSDAAAPFAQAMTDSVRNLELPFAIFEIDLQEIPVGPSGCDNVQFRFSATGRNAVDVAKCASGGELSRIMLALKAMRARYANMPTMVFDEIDTGVSGSVADKMGSMICDMGAFMQVFAITHLPQVAAKGKAHYLVSKDIDPVTSKAVSTIKRLSDQQRVLEVARMLSGSSLTDAAIANAKSLLSI
jgi:DNA repair protein RecN (Recombination protein N)